MNTETDALTMVKTCNLFTLTSNVRACIVVCQMNAENYDWALTGEGDKRHTIGHCFCTYKY